MGFEWDPDKARRNLEKHGVGFASAVIVLEDELALTVRDTRFASEDRFVTIGDDGEGALLIVVFTWRHDRIRIISARRATGQERRQYAGNDAQ